LKLTRPTAGLELRRRKAPGSSGRKPRAGRQREVSKETATPADPRTSKTPGFSRGGFIAVKVAGGCFGTGRKGRGSEHGARGEDPEEAQAQEGSGVPAA
jgi:hypothetical protein